jgi:hypothetical protein
MLLLLLLLMLMVVVVVLLHPWKDGWKRILQQL